MILFRSVCFRRDPCVLQMCVLSNQGNIVHIKIFMKGELMKLRETKNYQCNLLNTTLFTSIACVIQLCMVSSIKTSEIYVSQVRYPSNSPLPLDILHSGWAWLLGIVKWGIYMHTISIVTYFQVMSLTWHKWHHIDDSVLPAIFKVAQAWNIS